MSEQINQLKESAQNACNKEDCKKLIKEYGLDKYVYLLSKGFTLESYLTYVIVIVLAFVNIYVVRVTNLPVLTYAALGLLELYYINLAVTTFGAVKAEQSEIDAAVNKLFDCSCSADQCPIMNNEKVKEFAKQSWFKPAVISVGLLLLALVFHIFSGFFLSCVAFILLVAVPPFVKFGLDVKCKEFYKANLEPKIKELYETQIKPKLDKSAAPAPKTETKPAEAKKEESAPAPVAEPEAAPAAETSDAPAEEPKEE
ncbi:hypothetical protein BLNAU_17175 [Blattamonas nauphoetae]|uniref:Reticulon-like protein n=1 Tax=Blattamonas nauphoetae TaxID=2049346 RepID=A0ABQ9X7P9_9EUKA|nr:hypothetical protein BLNAU_17175 [Blattamonas nauphoetae]